MIKSSGIVFVFDDDVSIRHAFASLIRSVGLPVELFGSVIYGLLNKQVAAQIGTIVATVKSHRGQLMRKMNARPSLIW